jgi:hypothetical protein
MAKRRFTDDTNGGRAKDKRTDGDGTIPFSEMRFVRIELTEAEKEEFRALMANEEFTSDFLDKAVRAGYKVSFSLDKNGGGVLCSIRAESRGLLDAGLILTGRGKTIAVAVAVCEYKSNYLADENGWLAAETRRGGSFDDVG